MVGFETTDPELFKEAAESGLYDTNVEPLSAVHSSGGEAVASEAATVEYEIFDPEDYSSAAEEYAAMDIAAAVEGASKAATTIHYHGGEAIAGELESGTVEGSAEVFAAAIGGSHAHDPEHCDECLKEAQEEADMSLAMTGFAAFGMILFVMWYMLRSCKQKQEEEMFDPRNHNSRGRYRPALSPYDNEDNESVPQVELGGVENNY